MQIEVMSLRGSQWLQLFLEQEQIGQMVEHWCKEHPVACSTYYHWKKALREEFLARMEAGQGHPILPTAVTIIRKAIHQNGEEPSPKPATFLPIILFFPLLAQIVCGHD